MSQHKKQRLTSLDAFRGFTIAGMILVNQAGLEKSTYSWLKHADFDGCTFADLIFPFFLFIVGAAIALSVRKYNEDHKPTAAVYWRILRRFLILFALGLFLNGFWSYDFSTIRILGVLQRIALAYLLAMLIALNVPQKRQWVVAVVLLIGYWLAMAFIPVPESGVGNFTRIDNFGAYIDRLIIPANHLYQWDNYNGMGDPEGLFSTLPAVVTVLAGYFTTQWLVRQSINSTTSLNLAIFGLSSSVIGLVWNVWFPINKKLWTSSFVLFTAGIALLILAACYELIEVRGKRSWGKPLEILGLNPIFIFVASVLLIKILVKTKVVVGDEIISSYNFIYQHFFLSWAGPANGSFLFAISTLLLWWLVAWVMSRQGWFVKV